MDNSFQTFTWIVAILGPTSYVAIEGIKCWIRNRRPRRPKRLAHIVPPRAEREYRQKQQEARILRCVQIIGMAYIIVMTACGFIGAAMTESNVLTSIAGVMFCALGVVIFIALFIHVVQWLLKRGKWVRTQYYRHIKHSPYA